MYSKSALILLVLTFLQIFSTRCLLLNSCYFLYGNHKNININADHPSTEDLYLNGEASVRVSLSVTCLWFQSAYCSHKPNKVPSLLCINHCTQMKPDTEQESTLCPPPLGHRLAAAYQSACLVTCEGLPFRFNCQ
jgi:hypothetical protein